MADERRATIVGDPAVLRESLQRADALLRDEQAVIRDIREKAEGMGRLGVAAIGGMIAVVSLAIGSGISVGWGAFVALTIGVALEMGALGLFASVLVGPLPGRSPLGADVEALIEPLGEPRWTLASLRYSLLLSDGRLIGRARAAARIHAYRLAVGFVLLMAGAALHLGALAFIVGGVIH